MFFTLVVTLEPVLFFRPEPAPNRRNLKAAIARKICLFAGRSSPRLPRKSKRQAVFPTVWRWFLSYQRNFKHWVPLDDGPTPFSFELIRQYT